MKQWERALHVFLEEWKNREDVIGAIVCGSYVTGDPSPHSDIDVHLILSDEVNWRKRGNVVVDRYLIEYLTISITIIDNRNNHLHLWRFFSHLISSPQLPAEYQP